MPYLKHIVASINAVLEANLFQDDCFANRKVIGLAQGMPRTSEKGLEILPSYINDDGEAQYVGPEDDYDLIVYHRVSGISVGKSNTPSFGDSRRNDNNVARMSVVAFGRRDRLRMTNDELAILLQATMPEGITKEQLTELQFKTCNIIINDIILNDLQVFQEEFQGIEFFLKPEQFLLKVNYTIESTFLKECFTKCISCTS